MSQDTFQICLLPVCTPHSQDRQQIPTDCQPAPQCFKMQTPSRHWIHLVSTAACWDIKLREGSRIRKQMSQAPKIGSFQIWMMSYLSLPPQFLDTHIKSAFVTKAGVGIQLNGRKHNPWQLPPQKACNLFLPWFPFLISLFCLIYQPFEIETAALSLVSVPHKTASTSAQVPEHL